MATEAQLRANRKYAKKAYDKLDIRVPKGERDQFKAWASEQGLSLAEYVRRACYEKAGQHKD